MDERQHEFEVWYMNCLKLVETSNSIKDVARMAFTAGWNGRDRTTMSDNDKIWLDYERI